MLLSSHLLAEVERTTDRFVVIARGRIVAQGTRDELVGAGGDLEEEFLRRTGPAEAGR